MNPKSRQHRPQNTLHRSPYPCHGGLAHASKAHVEADGSHLIGIQCNLLLVGEKP